MPYTFGDFAVSVGQALNEPIVETYIDQDRNIFHIRTSTRSISFTREELISYGIMEATNMPFVPKVGIEKEIDEIKTMGYRSG